MKTSATMKRACNLALRRIRFERAGLDLPNVKESKDATMMIREATRLYFETWVEPLLMAIRDGDTATLAYMTVRYDCTDPDAVLGYVESLARGGLDGGD